MSNFLTLSIQELHDQNQLGFEDINRAIDVAFNLESLQTVVNRMKVIQPVDRALIQSVLDMATCGVSIKNKPVVIGFEDYSSYQEYIADNFSSDDDNSSSSSDDNEPSALMEGAKEVASFVGDKVKALGDSILTALGASVVAFGLFVKRLFNVYQRYEHRLNKLKDKLETIRNETSIRKISVEIDGDKFFRYKKNEVIPNAKEFLSAYKDSSQFFKSLNDTLIDYSIQTNSSKWSKFFTSLTPSGYESNFLNHHEEFRDKLFKDLISNCSLTPSSKDKYTESFVSAPLIGCTEILLSIPIESTYNDRTVDSVKSVLNDYSINSLSTVPDIGTTDATIYFKDVDLSYIGELLSTCEANLESFKELGDKMDAYHTVTGKIMRFFTSPGDTKIAGVFLNISKLLNKINSTLSSLTHFSWHRSKADILLGLEVAEELLDGHW